MLKFLLIVLIFGYIFFKGLGFIIRLILGGSVMNQYSNQQDTSQKSRKGNVHVDYVPKDKQNNKKGFNGGEYIDFEEVK